MVTSTPSADLEYCFVSEVSETGTWEQQTIEYLSTFKLYKCHLKISMQGISKKFKCKVER